MPFSHHVEGLEKRKSWGTNLAAIGAIAAIRDKAYPKLPLRRLNSCIRFSCRDMISFCIKLKMMNHCFHRGLHLFPTRRSYSTIFDFDRAFRKFLEALFYNLHT